jgi:UDP-GlcNAc:undecaprenyl-phosphate GlcNAc-1-phosphate transferase
VREYEYFLTLLVTAAVTYVLTPAVRRLALKIKAITPTRARDVHAKPTPRMGGLAMYLGVAAGLIVATELVPFKGVIAGTGLVNGLLLAGGLIVVIGIIDDKWGLNSIGKLAGQVAAAGVLVANGAQLSSFPLPRGGEFDLTYNEGVVVTIVLVVATINAVNFIDGLDGLAAGVVCIAAFSFFLYYYSLTKVATLRYAIPVEAVPALAAILLAGACIGFLPHNFHPARIFMGDTGSMLLGLLLAYIPISAISTLNVIGDLTHTANRYAEILPFLLPAAVMVIPYTDLLRAVIRRTRAGQSPLAADRQHLHHRMLDVGHSHLSSVLILYAWAALFAGAVVGLSILAVPLLILAGITLFAVLVLVLLSIPRLRFWERSRNAGGASRSASPAERVVTGAVAGVVPGAVPGGSAGASGVAGGASEARSAVLAAAPVPVALKPAAPERGVPERGVPERGAPERGASERGVPERGVPERGAPESAAPEPAARERVTPEPAAPRERTRYRSKHGAPEPPADIPTSPDLFRYRDTDRDVDRDGGGTSMRARPDTVPPPEQTVADPAGPPDRPGPPDPADPVGPVGPAGPAPWRSSQHMPPPGGVSEFSGPANQTSDPADHTRPMPVTRASGSIIP